MYMYHIVPILFRCTCWLFQIVYEGEIWCLSIGKRIFSYHKHATRDSTVIVFRFVTQNSISKWNGFISHMSPDHMSNQQFVSMFIQMHMYWCKLPKESLVWNSSIVEHERKKPSIIGRPTTTMYIDLQFEN